MRVELVPFEMEHLEQIEPRKVFHDKESLRESLTGLVGSIGCHTGTIKRGDTVLAIAGIVHVRSGFYEVWTVTSDDVSGSPISFHKIFLSMIRHFEKRFSIRRLQMTVKEGYSEGARWAESLGFRREGVMRQFDTDGSSHVLFARVNSDV